MCIKIVSGYEKQEEINTLFSEYTTMLIKNDKSVKQYLDIQNYDEEIKHLKTKYGMPEGRLYIVYYDKKLAGCIALRKLDTHHCEIKRLYVRAKFRGKKLGNMLIEKIIEDAKKIGYSYILLDTLPFLQTAIHLYQKYGFYEIDSYNNSPIDTTIYMKLNL